MKLQAYVLTILVSCSKSPRAGLPDGSPDVPTAIDAPVSSTVRVAVRGELPMWIEYRDGNGPWLVPEQASQQTFDLHVTNDYELIAVCGDSLGFDAEEIAYTAGDGPDQYMFCGRAPEIATVAITGQMNQPGSVTIDHTASGTTAPWQFVVAVAPGIHDLIATGGDRMLIRRGLAITGASTLPTVDLAADGSALVPVDLTVAGTASDDTVSTTTSLITGTGGETATIARSPGSTALTVPPSLLQTGDLQVLAGLAMTATSMRWFDTVIGADTSFALLPRLSGVAFGVGLDPSATWGTLPDCNDVWLYLDAPSTTTTLHGASQHVTASAAWLAETGATAIAFDSSSPSYSPAWQIDPSGPHDLVFGVEQYAAHDTVYGTAVRASTSSAAAFSLPRRRLVSTNSNNASILLARSGRVAVVLL